MAGKPQYQQGAMAVNSTVENHKGAEAVVVDGEHNDTGDAAVRSIAKLRSQDSLPKKKSSTFQITSVKKQLPGEQGVEDIDSLDDLDETHTEDVSSNLLDVSQSTDVEPDPPSLDAGQGTAAVNAEEMSKQEVVNHVGNHTSGNGIHNHQAGGNGVIVSASSAGTIAISNASSKDKDSQSRFKVVKIESKEPFKRGRWTCLDYLDPHPEKAGQNEKAEVVPKQGEEVGSGNSSAASSVHYVPGVDDPSKNPFGQSGPNSNEGGHPVAEVGQTHGQASTMQNGQSTAQGQENSSGHVAPQKGVAANGQSSLQSQSSINAQPQASLQGQGVTTPGNVTMQQSAVPAERNTDFIPGQDPYLSQQGQDYVSHGNDYDYRTSAQNVDVNPSQPSEYNQTQQATDYTQAPHSLSSQPSLPQQGATASNQPAGLANSGTSPNKDNLQTLESGSKEGAFSAQPGADQAIGQPEPVPLEAKGLKSFPGAFSLKPFSSQAFPPPLLEMVSAHMQQQPQFGIIPRPNDEGGASTVAIDNKIEQAMDLVKSHLMFAVREEVDVLKEQIKELLEKNSALEYENNMLRSKATPETLAKLDVVKPQPPTTTS